MKGFFFFPFIFISCELITSQHCSGFLSYFDMNQPWSYMYSPSRSPLPPPSPPNYSGSSQCTNPICKTEKETQVYRTDFWTLWEKARVGCFERTASKRVLSIGKQITSPGWMHETGARAWCTGKTQKVKVFLSLKVKMKVLVAQLCDSL